MKKGILRSTAQIAQSLGMFCATILSGSLGMNVYAAPQGGIIVDGNGSISHSGLNTTIQQNSQLLSATWKSFDVNSNERVQFIQPNISSIALNRILGNNASQIRGRIDANGQIILVNPNGIFFGSTATINVGGLIASGLDIKSADFMNGKYVFSEVMGTDGVVVNSGSIYSSDTVLYIGATANIL